MTYREGMRALYPGETNRTMISLNDLIKAGVFPAPIYIKRVYNSDGLTFFEREPFLKALDAWGAQIGKDFTKPPRKEGVISPPKPRGPRKRRPKGAAQ